MIIANYLKIALRNFTKRKVYSFINASGLSIAIAFSVLVYLYVTDELSFDSFHPDKERIYFLKSSTFDKRLYESGNPDFYRPVQVIASGMGEAIRSGIPEVEKISLGKMHEGVLQVEDKVLRQEVYHVDSSYFQIFSFEVVAGSLNKIFSNPNEVVLSEDMAMKHFGTTDVIGLDIKYGSGFSGDDPYTIKAVLRMPKNSSLQFEMLLPLRVYFGYRSGSWNTRQYYTFVKLREGASIESVEDNMNRLLADNRKDYIDRVRSENTLDPLEPVESMYLLPLKEVHYDPDMDFYLLTSDKRYPVILSAIAILIIMVACINYTLFAITSSVSRRKEVGIRKSIGATGNQVFLQFNLEAIAIAGISALLGLILASATLPLFNSFTAKQLALESGKLLPVVTFLLSLTIVIGSFAGSYPSWYVSRIRPVKALRSQGSALKSGLARPMVVLQFALSAVLMVSTYIMFRQMQFIATRSLGFDGDNVIVVRTYMDWGPEADNAIEQYRLASLSNPAIIDVAGVVNSISRGYMSTTLNNEDKEVTVVLNRIDDHFVPMMEIELLQGRNFDAAMSTDSSAIIVNEALVKAMEWEEPLNQTLDIGRTSYRVIAVASDFHFESLEDQIRPLALFGTAASGQYLITLMAKLSGADLPASLASAEQTWKSLFPNRPFQFSFVDDDVAQQYQEYQRWTNITAASTLLALIIAGMGMFGLAGIVAVNRTKEIGIRKVLGAGVRGIFLLLLKPFVIMASIAFVLATPISWYLLNNWVDQFSYHISIGWEIFAVSMIMGLVIAVVSVSYHGFRSATVNPAEILKNE